MNCEVSQTNDVKTPGILHISRFYEVTHEIVVMPATDFGILRKCLGFKLTSHEI